MDQVTENPVPSDQATLCSVCAWRQDCKKKFTYQQGGAAKCPDYTRDAALPREEPHNP